MTLGQRLREAREAQGMTQTQVAERLNLSSPASILAFEKDKAEPSLKQLRLLANALGVGTSYLLDGEVSDDKTRPHQSPKIHSHQGFQWIVDLDTYPSSKRQQWGKRMSKAADLFSDVMHGQRTGFKPSDGVRLRSAFEARVIRLIGVKRNELLEKQLKNKYNLSNAFVIDIDMPANDPVTCMVGCELVGLATASPEYGIFEYLPEETTNILIAHGMVLHRFVQNIRPSGYIYKNSKFFAMTAVQDVEQAHPDRTANALVSTLASKFPRGHGIHMPFLTKDLQEKVFNSQDLLEEFDARSREGAVAGIVHAVKKEPITVYLSAIRIDERGFPITTPSDGGNAATTTDHIRAKLQKAGLWDRFGGDVSGIALDKEGGLLERSDYYCSLPPNILQEVVQRGFLVWLIGAGVERSLSFHTCLKAKIVNSVVVTRDLAYAILEK